MDGWLRDRGFDIAQNLPGALAGSAFIIVLAGWALYKVRSDNIEPTTGLTILLGGVILATVVGLPAAYSSAQDFCRSVGPTLEIPNTLEPVDLPGFNNPETLTFSNPNYAAQKCNNVWPGGPP